MATVLVTLHGGNFVGGDAAWDAEQTQFLKNLGYQVHQLAFPTGSLSAAIAAIREQVDNIKRANPTSYIGVIGRSSGGYLAKVLFDEGLFSKALYLAPVFSPQLRAMIKPTLGAASKGFFENERSIPSTTHWTPTHELLLLATDDENVPPECFTMEQLAAAIYLGPRTHSEMVKIVSNEFRTRVLEFFLIH